MDEGRYFTLTPYWYCTLLRLPLAHAAYRLHTTTLQYSNRTPRVRPVTSFSRNAQSQSDSLISVLWQLEPKILRGPAPPKITFCGAPRGALGGVSASRSANCFN